MMQNRAHANQNQKGKSVVKKKPWRNAEKMLRTYGHWNYQKNKRNAKI